MFHSYRSGLLIALIFIGLIAITSLSGIPLSAVTATQITSFSQVQSLSQSDQEGSFCIPRFSSESEKDLRLKVDGWIKDNPNLKATRVETVYDNNEAIGAIVWFRQ